MATVQELYCNLTGGGVGLLTSHFSVGGENGLLSTVFTYILGLYSSMKARTKGFTRDET